MKKTNKSKRTLILSCAVLLLIIIASLLAPLSPYDPNAINTLEKFLSPSAAHWLGTDNFGRDTFTRILYGGRVSLMVGFLSMLVSIVFGTVYGIVSGVSGKVVDGIMMRIVDILMSVPSFLIIITLNIYMNAGIKTSVLVASTNSIASAILTESSLSYLGFGITIPNASWGGMLEGAQTYILTHPMLAVYPGACILITVLSFNVLGNAIRRSYGSGR